MTSKPLVSCLCCTYGRPTLLGEAVKCFLDQDYPNKELIIINDQPGVSLRLVADNVFIYNHEERFNSLGEKRNHSKIAKGEYFCIWDDDDLYTPWRISESIEYMEQYKHVDIVKGKFALMSVNNSNYKVVSNLFHSQACIRKNYMDSHFYPDKSVGEDISFENGAKVQSVSVRPFYWYVYRWGLNVHHLSGISDDKKSWEKSLTFEPYNETSGEVVIKPEFQRDYWKDVEEILSGKDKEEWVARWKNF